jgi:methylated-DNA-[protein]-cysteine S-methyltransferase
MTAERASPIPYQAIAPAPLPGTPYLGLRIEAGCLTAIDYLPQAPRRAACRDGAAVIQRLQHYFAGDTRHADVCLKPTGTPFQQQVWQLLQRIPHGEVRTYGELAGTLGSSARAVAGACRANPIPILIPCHRVIAANGPGGYLGKRTGPALAIKQWLLQHEGHV